jgi:hypothetical protein
MRAAMHSISVSGASDRRPFCFFRARTKTVCGSSGGSTVVVRLRGENVRMGEAEWEAPRQREERPLPPPHDPVHALPGSNHEPALSHCRQVARASETPAQSSRSALQ